MIKSESKHIGYSKILVRSILLPALIIILLKIFALTFFKIRAVSMEPTILPGEIILVSKMSYGSRLLNLYRYITASKIEFIRIKGWNKPKRGDVIVFNWPNYYSVYDSTSSIYGDYTVKRCYGLPGDSVLITNNKITNVSHNFNTSLSKEIPDSGYVLFPHDSTLSWTLRSYGPLYVPAKGQSIIVTQKTLLWYKDILKYENPNSLIRDNIFFINDKAVLQYTFQHNYYFMLGDNFNYSQDSRYWGFVPDGNIIGKGALILISVNTEGKGFKKIRFNRTLTLL